MKNRWLLALFVGTLGLFCAFAVTGQTAATPGGQYVISAKAGGVNFVSGKVTVIRRAGTSGLLLLRDEVQVGDRVTTGEDGNAEILLNPGSFIRLGSNSSFDFASTDLENLRLNLRSGSAVFEVIATEDFVVSVRLPKSNLQLNHSGVFRIDVLTDGSGKLAVFKGMASVGPAMSTEVKSGREATISGGGVSISKFDRDTNDPLDIWSKERAKELAKLNAKFERRTLRDSLLNSFNSRGWNLYNSFGLWVFDPRFGSCLFLPFGYGWSSPYGWGYGYDLYRFGMPAYIWRSPTYYPPTTSGGGGTPPPQTQSNEERRVREHTPPFVRVEQATRAEGGYIKGDDGRGSSPTFPSNGTPIISAPPVSAPPISAPIRNTQSGETKGRPGR